VTRAAALARLAAGCLGQGSLLEYTPGELLVVDHRLLDRDCIVIRRNVWQTVAEPDDHVFQAAPFTNQYNRAQKAWGYAVDPNA